MSKYEKCEDTRSWKKLFDLPRTENDDTEIMLQLKLDRTDKFLFGKNTLNIFGVKHYLCRFPIDGCSVK